MEMTEKIKELCDKKGISIRKVESDLNLGNGTLMKMSAKSQIAKIKMISDYFGVSMSYLMGWENENKMPSFEPDHIELIRLYSMLTREQKDTVMNMLRSFV